MGNRLRFRLDPTNVVELAAGITQATMPGDTDQGVTATQVRGVGARLRRVPCVTSTAGCRPQRSSMLRHNPASRPTGASTARDTRCVLGGEGAADPSQQVLVDWSADARPSARSPR